MLRSLFFALLPFALLGDARVFLFILNRFVFGSHREEKSPWTWMLWVVPPILLALTLLFWPLHRFLQWLASHDLVERMTPEPLERIIWSIPLAKIGAMWLFIAAGIGVYWILDRTRLLLAGPPRVDGVRSAEPFRLRPGTHINVVYDLEVTRHEIFIDDLPEPFDGFRIAFLTDTHVATFVRRTFYRDIADQVARFDPDVILLGGDFVTWNRHIPRMAEELIGQLRARHGMFAVLGNHDYWAGADDVKAAMTARGVRFIINRAETIHRGGAELPIVGIDEIYRGEPDVDAAFANVRPGPRIGLTHHPDMIDMLDRRRLDLLVCGHTHGGQIRVPFFGAIVVPSQHESRYASGFHRVGDVLMYVSRGIGAIPPVRILCPPEIATFVLRRSTRQPPGPLP